ncbi:hypothetical protein [Streptosporangium sp. NPDC002721]|uniref:hypothetical protein n=1 Tax=Streptosporangium sp. NPDC002721 TaxID=3366188 RepID=UPI0036B8CE30
MTTYAIRFTARTLLGTRTRTTTCTSKARAVTAFTAAFHRQAKQNIADAVILAEVARPNQLIADLADAAKADRLAKADRAARLAVAVLGDGHTETAALLFQEAVALRAAA